MQIGYKSMSLQKFTEAVEKTRELCNKEGVDIIINLTTSGGEYEDHKRLQHLSALQARDVLLRPQHPQLVQQLHL